MILKINFWIFHIHGELLELTLLMILILNDHFQAEIKNKKPSDSAYLSIKNIDELIWFSET